MTQEDKELLLNDLCARLPYGVMLNIEDVASKYNNKLFGLSFNHGNSIYINGLCVDNNGYDCYAKIKPYLFPLSSMTEEQEYQWHTRSVNPLFERLEPHTKKEDRQLTADSQYFGVEWLYKHHFDVVGLIEKGLAIDATNLNIY